MAESSHDTLTGSHAVSSADDNTISALTKDDQDHREDSAVATVLKTTELLELILISLDTKTLLLSQRVGKTWNAFINESKNLRKRLFLEPVSSFEEAEALNMAMDRGDVLYSKEQGNAILNGLTMTCKFHRWNDEESSHFNFAVKENIVPRGEPSKLRSGSWERMYLWQPPDSSFLARSAWIAWTPDYYLGRWVHHDSHQRLGDLMKQLETSAKNRQILSPSRYAEVSDWTTVTFQMAFVPSKTVEEYNELNKTYYQRGE